MLVARHLLPPLRANAARHVGAAHVAHLLNVCDSAYALEPTLRHLQRLRFFSAAEPRNILKALDA